MIHNQAPGFRLQTSGFRPQATRQASWFHCNPGARSLEPGAFPPRRAFTLTELLVVITIIGMLASMTMGAIYAARESARVTRTKATIAKLDTFIQAKYGEFFSRRMPIPNRRMPPDAMAELRMRVLHEIMRMEMPDRLTDITWPRHPSNSGTGTLDMVAADVIGEVHPFATFADTTRSSRKWIDIKGLISTTQPLPDAPTGMQRTSLGKRLWRQIYAARASIDPEYDAAECLYLIVQADPEAREHFQAGEIGDADNDGLFEFQDAWGMPIYFLRWAPGFVSESELMTGIDHDNDPSTPLVGDAESDPDPMNPRRIGELYDDNGKWIRPASISTFRLVPLIYSAGPDKKYGLLTVNTGYLAQMSVGDSLAKVWIDGADLGRPVAPGDGLDDEIGTHFDNITNHSIGMN